MPTKGEQRWPAGLVPLGPNLALCRALRGGLESKAPQCEGPPSKFGGVHSHGGTSKWMVSKGKAYEHG